MEKLSHLKDAITNPLSSLSSPILMVPAKFEMANTSRSNESIRLN
jgi:hypothetical protein